ncbi:MAG: NAD(P)H-binding protein, partial [Thermoleophilaceae bacterium]
MELVTGATGYVGGRLVERLGREGRPVRALARDPSRLAPRPGVEVAGGDLLSGRGIREALVGVDTAYYLVHSMEAAQDADFSGRDRRAAENFATAAREAGVERIAYLGGMAPSDGPLSPHIASRVEVEEILLESAPSATALRASILIGARSSSFRMLVRLVERLRLLPLPGWRRNRTQPIAERDAIEYLARTPRVAGAAGRSLDICGPDVVSYGQIVRQIAESMGVGRMALELGVSLTPPASAMVSAVTDQPVELVRPLMESLQRELLPRDA